MFHDGAPFHGERLIRDAHPPKGKAKTALRSVIDIMDHHYMNELPEFSAQNPTAENVAKLIFDRLKADYDSISSVSVWETPTSCATYSED